MENTITNLINIASDESVRIEVRKACHQEAFTKLMTGVFKKDFGFDAERKLNKLYRELSN